MKKNIIRLIFIFVFFMLIYNFFGYYHNIYDATLMYGYSRSLIYGKLPYLDLNIVSTPLYFYYSSLFLLINDSFITFTVSNAIIGTLIFYLLFKLYDYKAYLFILLISICKLYPVTQTYNLLMIFWFVLIFYLYKNKKSNYLIGLCIGLSILTKHSIGVFFLLPFFCYLFKDIKSFFKIILGIFIPLILFIIYLFIFGLFKDFVNLSILGMLDFSSTNNLGFNIWFILSIIIIIINIYILTKNKDKMTYLFLLVPIGFIIPICDFNHFSYFLFSTLVIYLINFNYKFKYSIPILVCSILFILGYFFININTFKTTFYHSKYYPDFYTSSDFVKLNDDVDKLVLKYKMNNYILLGENAVFYNINHDRSINYYTNLLYGNFGYDGENKILKDFDNKKDTYFIINKSSYNNINQFDNNICDYIFKKYKLIGEDSNYFVYYKK